MTFALVALANTLVGACIGLTGVAGFLLPMFYTGFVCLAPVDSLALSFAAFIVSGLLGCPAYRRTGDLPLRTTAWFGAGSLAGALAGVRIGLALPAEALTVALYAVVLVSGASVLLRMLPRRGGRTPARPAAQEPAGSHASYALIGAATACICSATGAGGPVLVMPTLMLLRFPPRTAVAMSLLDSVAIAVPSAVGYFASGAVTPLAWALLVPALLGHAVGTVAGSRSAARIDANLLKGIVAVGSMGIALLKLGQALL